MQLQIGIPLSALRSAKYVNRYYDEFLFNKMNFIEHLESRWNFEKKKLEERLGYMEPDDKYVRFLCCIFINRPKINFHFIRVVFFWEIYTRQQNYLMPL